MCDMLPAAVSNDCYYYGNVLNVGHRKVVYLLKHCINTNDNVPKQTECCARQ